MGQMEENNKRRIRRGQIQKIILQSVKFAGVLSVALLAPNALIMMKKFGLMQNKRQSEIVKSSTKKLTKKGLLGFKDGKYHLTKLGEQNLRIWELSDYKLPINKKWDRKWRVIIFDIPEYKRNVRNQIRFILNSAGFYRLQDSVWVSPADCEEVISLLKADFNIGRDLLYMIVDEIENDKHLLVHFQLNK